MALAAREGLAGIEFCAGIPDSVGGGIRMNAGAWGQAIGDRTDWVRCLRPDGTEAVIPGADLGFEYRGCPGLRGAVVVEASFRLETGAPNAVGERVRALLEKRAWLGGRRTAGSVFRNPPGESAGRFGVSL